jgi:DNA primase
MFTKESLATLKEKIDLLEVVSAHVDMKRAGATYKGLCPFHQEKNPSFIIQKGDMHYHCFGCGAHGDAIQFLMEYLNLSFVDAVDSLAERFHVSLEKLNSEEKVADKAALKEICALASHYFHANLIYTEEGKKPLHYLFQRGLTLDFINRFEIGFAPQESKVFRSLVRAEKINESHLMEGGLLVEGGRPFFRDRITFPIRNSTGAVIGFSARKYKEETFGGKYINTPETPLFKKSQILFGLNYCRRRIVKERRALIVEGQIDCLRLIEAGLNLSVAALGTAFGESHCNELKKLGVRTAYLLFDGDEAGRMAASKVGDLLQKRGIDVFVIHLPQGSDPDTYLTQFGIARLIEEIEQGESYLAFQVGYLSRDLNLNSPAAKAELVKNLQQQIGDWDDPVMVHESLRKIASLVRLPEEMVGVTYEPSTTYIIKNRLTPQAVDSDRVLELDLLRWLVLVGEPFLPTVKTYLKEKHFLTPTCCKMFQNIMAEGKTDLFTVAADSEDPTFIDDLLQKKVNRDRAEVHFLETVQKLLDREWMQTREAIKMEIHSGVHGEGKILELAKQFDTLKTHRPTAVLINRHLA